MNDNQLVSVIVTTFNRKELLKETIDSILNQTYKTFELIVVDNYSDYDFISHIKSFNDDRIRPFQNANNGIIAVNRNIGIKKSNGEYIAFCDDDDKWFPSKLEKQIKRFSSNVLLVCSNALRVSKRNKVPLLNIRNDTIVGFNDIVTKNQIVTSSVILRNQCIKLVDYMSENKELIAVEDYDYWLRILNNKNNSILVLKECLLNHCEHLLNVGISKTINGSYKKNLKLLSILEKYKILNNDIVKQRIKKLKDENNVLRQIIEYRKGNIPVIKFLSNKNIKNKTKIKWLFGKYIFRSDLQL